MVTKSKTSNRAVNPTKKSVKSKKKSVKSRKPAGTLNGQLTAMERQLARAKQPIAWSDRRVAIVKALRKLRAFGLDTARTAMEISTSSGVDTKLVKHHCDVYLGAELVKQGYVESIRNEGVRELSYYLTSKGRETDFTDGKVASTKKKEK